MKLLLQNGKKYHSLGSNNCIELYVRIDLWYAKLLPQKHMYYRMLNRSTRKVKRLTKTNLRNDFKGTPFEKKIFAFLEHHHPYYKDKKKKNYKILESLGPN